MELWSIQQLSQREKLNSFWTKVSSLILFSGVQQLFLILQDIIGANLTIIHLDRLRSDVLGWCCWMITRE